MTNSGGLGVAGRLAGRRSHGPHLVAELTDKPVV